MLRMRRDLHMFDYVWLYIWKQSSRQALLLKKENLYISLLWFRRYCVKKAEFYNLYKMVTLKIRSR